MIGVFKKNNFLLGVFLGLIFPGVASLLSYYLRQTVLLLSKEDLLYIGSVAINLFLIKGFLKYHAYQSGRGIILGTFICAFIFLFYKMSLSDV